MENLEFESINNFKVAVSADSVISPLTPVDTEESMLTPIEKSTDAFNDDSITYGVTNFMWIGTVLISFVIWITCVISLILNCVRKNVGKAVFSGIGLVIPILSIFISTIGKTFVELEDGMEGIGMFLAILAIVIEVVVEIIAFIFCFSKNKNKTHNE